MATDHEVLKDFLFSQLKQAIHDHADALKTSMDLGRKIGGLATVSCSAKVTSGPLAGQTVEIAIAINPED